MVLQLVCYASQKLHNFCPKLAKIVQNQTKIKVAETEKRIKKDNTLKS